MTCPAIISLALAAALPSGAAVLTEDFTIDPLSRGWRQHGDPSLFHWNSTNQNLEVTWDSSRTNSFFMFPLGTVLAKDEDFGFSFDLRLHDIRAGTTPGKTNEFEIAIGLLNQRPATNTGYYRGAGVSPAYGVRNIVEFNYFPDAGFGDTWATTVISSNNVFAFGHNFPLALSTGDVFRITLAYTSRDHLLRTTATRNGAPLGPLENVSLADKPDFRVDAFAVISYSDAFQYAPPAFQGSVLAHGIVDNVSLVLPDSTAGPLRLSRRDTGWRIDFPSRSNWLYTLERCMVLPDWGPASPPTAGNGGILEFNDSNNPGPTTFYRVRAERP